MDRFSLGRIAICLEAPRIFALTLALLAVGRYLSLVNMPFPKKWA